MPDHLNFLISPETDGVSIIEFTERFKGKSTNASWSCGWKGKLWQPRFYDHIIRNEESVVDIANYILFNPVRKGLVSKPEEWPCCGHMNDLRG